MYSESIRREFNKFVSYVRENEFVPLSFVPLDLESMHISVFTDASFASNVDFTPKLGIVVTLRDKYGSCNIVHASSIKAQRRARSVLSAEMFALMDGFDIGYVVRATCANHKARC